MFIICMVKSSYMQTKTRLGTARKQSASNSVVRNTNHKTYERIHRN
jgi:hypothetical protein